MNERIQIKRQTHKNKAVTTVQNCQVDGPASKQDARLVTVPTSLKSDIHYPTGWSSDEPILPRGELDSKQSSRAQAFRQHSEGL